MDNYLLISQLPITSVLDKLGIKYSRLGCNCLGLWEDGRLTNGWRVNVSKNYVKDFSKDRPHGSPYLFIKLYLNYCDKEVFQWFSDQFGLKNNNLSINKNKIFFNKKRESMKLPKYNSNW